MECIKCRRELKEGAAFCPFCGEKVAVETSGEDKPLYLAEVKKMLKSGTLAVYRDRAEFVTSSVQKMIFSYSSLMAVKKGIESISFITDDGRTESCPINRKNIHEAFLYIEQASRPFIAERQRRLLSEGIRYSLVSSQGLTGGILNIMNDKAEFRAKSGQSEIIFFQDVISVRLTLGMLEFSLTDGTLRSYMLDADVAGEVLFFVENAIRPYVIQRTEGFDKVFGIDERIEINENRAVFHIVRQGGREISNEFPINALTGCEWTECSEPTDMLGSVVSGGLAFLKGAAKAVGAQATSEEEERISYAGVVLTLNTQQGGWTEIVRFGDFRMGMSRTNPKYDGYIAEISRFMDYLGSSHPECERIIPVLPGPENIESEVLGIEEKISGEGEKIQRDTDKAEKKDQFGITKYIDRMSRFIGECETPMTIAIQGSWGRGENSILRMIYDNLEERYPDNLIWFNTQALSEPDLGEPLPKVVGKMLIGQLSGTDNAATKERLIEVGKGIFGVAASVLSQGGTDGKSLLDALLKDNSLEKRIKMFSELVEVRLDESNDKVVIFVDDLAEFAPVKGVEILEAMKNFFNCKGCVFVVSTDYNSVIRGANEKYGQEFDENTGKSFFNKIFQISFRVPTSSFDVQNYVKDKLEHIGIDADEEELEFYVGLIRQSMGSEPKSIDRLFNSFLLLKKLADEELYESKDRRLMLFALICMQARYYDAYNFIVRMKDQVTPDFLAELCGEQSEILNHSGLSDEERAKLRDFAVIFTDIIDTDGRGAISEEECRVFAEVLEFSSITAK